MPLTWNVKQAADVDLILNDDQFGLTQTLILNTVNVGMGSITEKNADEFYARIHFLEQLYGNLLLATDKKTGKVVDRPITPEDVRLRIGLVTNVATESRASFVRRHVTNGTIRDALYEYRHHIRKLATDAA